MEAKVRSKAALAQCWEQVEKTFSSKNMAPYGSWLSPVSAIHFGKWGCGIALRCDLQLRLPTKTYVQNPKLLQNSMDVL